MGDRLCFVLALGAVGCAQASPDDPDGGRGRLTDAPIGEEADAKPPPPDGAPRPDAMTFPDAMPHPDGCTVQQIQVLANPAFDNTGGWTQMPSDPMYPIIGPPPDTAHTAPNIAWMGGLYNANDRLYQDVTIPAGASALMLRGQRWIQTEELFPIPFDNVTIDIRDTGDAVLANLAEWSNADDVGTWTQINEPSPAAFAGQTIRLDFRATTDDSWHTNFLFDSLALRATVCQ